MIDTTGLPVGHRCKVWKAALHLYGTRAVGAEYLGDGKFRVGDCGFRETVEAKRLYPSREAAVAGLLEMVTKEMERLSRDLANLARTHARLLKGEVPGERKRKPKETAL